MTEPDLKAERVVRTWRVRNRVRVTPPLVRVGRSDPAAWAASRGAPSAARFAELAARYDVSRWGRVLWPHEVGECCYVLDVCDRYLAGAVGPGLDVGAKNATYLPALAAAVAGEWTAVELDAHRRYANLQTRASVGRWRARRIPGARFVAGDVADLDGAFGTITWFLPFLTPAALAKWGLPSDTFRPRELLAHVVGLLAPGGRLLVVNQGKREAELQQALFDQARIAATPLGQLQSPLSPFRSARYGFVVPAVE